MMKDIKYNLLKVFLLPFSIILFLAYGCTNNNSSEKKTIVVKTDTNNRVKNAVIAIAPPPFSEGIFPCSDCHAYQDTNPEKRELVDMHDDISAMFDHDAENRWCLDCHNANDRDYLHLANGKLVSFEESYKLCGQCHGNKLRDWKVGVHGKRTGNWNGKKEYYLCVSCHNPHSPHFKPLKPMPAPVPQSEIKLNKKK